MHGLWISVTGRFFQSYPLEEKTPLQCYNELLFEFTADGLGLNGWVKQVLDTRVNLLIVLPAVWPACCFAHGALVSINFLFTKKINPLSLPLHVPLSLSAPLVLWTAARDAQGCWVKQWAALTGDSEERARKKNVVEWGEHRGERKSGWKPMLAMRTLVEKHIRTNTRYSMYWIYR